jgi:hypothetical protein
MSDTDRLIRQIQNAKGNSIAEGSQRGVMAHAPSRYNMSEGEQVFAQEANKPLALYKKNKGMLHKVNLSSDGNQYIERNLNITNDLNVNGTIYGNQIYCYSHNFDYSGTSKVYLPWNSISEATSVGFYDQFIIPFSGKLIRIIARPESSSGSTAIGFHKASDGTTDPSTSATETITVNIASADTSYNFDFTDAAKFNQGDVVGISYNPSSAPNETKITSVWLLNIAL